MAPQAQYVHCYAHCLNLVLVDCCKIVTEAANFFTLLEALYVFISSAKAHEIYVKTQSELYPTKQVRQLVRLSDTRWTSRHSSIDAVCYTFDSILQTLEKLKDDKDKCIQAGGLLCQIKSFKFVVQLVTFSRILGITNRLSEQLQCKDLDLAAAANLVSATMSTLNSLRSDKEWSHLYSYICDVAKLYCISSGNSRPTRTRNLPQYLRNGEVIPLENIQTSSIPDFKTSFYYPILDCILLEFKERFSDNSLQIMRAVQCCSPISPDFLDPEELFQFSQLYNINVTLETESTLAKATIESKENIDTLGKILSELNPLEIAFPNVVQILQLALTVVVSSASCERSFSALKRIKTYLRSTMKDERLDKIAILSIEKDLSKNLNLDTVIDQFNSLDKNHRIILN